MDNWSDLHLKLAELLGFGPRQPRPLPRGATRTSRKTIALCHSLLSERGEVSGSRLAAEALDAYQALDDRGRRAFFESLIREFSPDPEEVGRAGDAYRSDPSAGESRAPAKGGGAASPGAVPPAEPGARRHAHSGGDAKPGAAGV